MDPAVVLCQIRVDALELAADGVTKVLGGNAHCGTEHADDGAALVEELEGPVVDVGLIKLEVVGEIAEKVRHGDPSTRDPAASPPARRSNLTSQQLGSNRRSTILL